MVDPAHQAYLNALWLNYRQNQMHNMAQAVFNPYDMQTQEVTDMSAERCLTAAFDDGFGYCATSDLSAAGLQGPIEGLTPEQRFFVSFAQGWRTRVRPEQEAVTRWAASRRTIPRAVSRTSEEVIP